MDAPVIVPILQLQLHMLENGAQEQKYGLERSFKHLKNHPNNPQDYECSVT